MNSYSCIELYYVSNYTLFIISGLHIPIAAAKLIQAGKQASIPCIFVDQDRINALYWRINDQDYDLYSVPGVFNIDENVLILHNITIAVHRWRLQCFTINEDSLNFGEYTDLQVCKSFSVSHVIASQPASQGYIATGNACTPIPPS